MKSSLARTLEAPDLLAVPTLPGVLAEFPGSDHQLLTFLFWMDGVVSETDWTQPDHFSPYVSHDTSSLS